MQTRLFGRADGQDVHEVTLASRAGAQAKILSWGAVVRDFTVPDGAAGQKVVLGFDRLENYLLHSPHFGAMAGRFANRIAHGRFRLDNRQYQLETNEAGRHALHGGSRGFGARPWRLEGADAHAVRLRLVSPAGEGGYPGRLDTICTYRLLEPAILRLEIEATADAPTIVNLAHHSYFNLAQHGADVPSVLDHHLAVNAQFYTPVDAELIPTGEIRAVAGTPYDFRTARPLRNPEHLAYDINYVLADIAGDQDGGLALAAALHAPSNELSLSVFTSEPGLQVYDGAKLAVPCAGLDGARYARHAGLCLEPQRFPDSPNRRHFSAARLDPDEIYRETTEYHVLRRG